ncbi:hypothetical protein BH10PLA2_BH10PLA2_14060 [soil metagenome]
MLKLSGRGNRWNLTPWQTSSVAAVRCSPLLSAYNLPKSVGATECPRPIRHLGFSPRHFDKSQTCTSLPDAVTYVFPSAVNAISVG